MKYGRITVISFFNLFLGVATCWGQSLSEGETIMNIKGYPTVFELNVADEYVYLRSREEAIIKHTIKLINVKPVYTANFWNLDKNGDGAERIFQSAEIDLEIDGNLFHLVHRPYEFPVTIGGLRVYIEAISDWVKGADLADLSKMKKSVRLSVCLEDESWGPETLAYHIDNYRFRSSSYNNTWGSLVPYAPLYYHKGEDRGAIPDRLSVHAPIAGEIIGWPLPGGDGLSNGIIIKDTDGIIFRIAHMNTEHINSELRLGDFVKNGDFLGFTGSTWLGGRNQTHDPHVHLEMWYVNGDTAKLSPYPYLIEAYLRKYANPVIAVAGGYEFTVPGKTIQLDGSRSISGSGERVKKYKWILHDGKAVNAMKATLAFNQPGLFTEELIVETENGSIDRDFLQVKVWDTTRLGAEGRDIAFGWIYQYPVRDVKVGESVMFWNRIHHSVGSVYIDFGDGTNPVKFYSSMAHPYLKKGRYVVKVWGIGPREEPFTQKLEVIVGTN